MYRGGQNRGTTVSVYSGGSWCGAAFQSMLFGILSKMMVLRTQKHIYIFIHHAIAYGKCLTGSDFSFHHNNDPKHAATLHTCGTVTDGPAQSLDINFIKAMWDHLDKTEQKGRQNPQKRFECPSRSLDNYSWKQLQESCKRVTEVALKQYRLSIQVCTCQ